MDTKVVKIHKENIDLELLAEAGDIIKKGGIVAFPTETVYGLGADGLNEEAVKKIYKAKGRPSDNPLILHISSIEELYPLVKEIPELAYEVIEKFWPGPLTIIFKKSSLVPHIITAGLDSVAIRMPRSAIAQELIRMSGTTIAAPSANLSGRPSPTRGDHVIEDMIGKIEMIIDGGRTGVGLESTVLDLSDDKATILRPGAITFEDLKEIIPHIKQDISITNQGATPKSPGQKYRHYAPKSEMILFTGGINNIVYKINEYLEKFDKDGLKVGVMATKETINRYNSGIIKEMGSRAEEESIAENLFDIIREFDNEDIDIILAEGIDLDNIGTAIMNRLIKASGGRIIET